MSNGPVDFLDQNIQVGDTIVYPNRKGSSLWMNKAKVIGMKMTDEGDPMSPFLSIAFQSTLSKSNVTKTERLRLWNVWIELLC